jgi:hypothetical protein
MPVWVAATPHPLCSRRLFSWITSGGAMSVRDWKPPFCERKTSTRSPPAAAVVATSMASPSGAIATRGRKGSVEKPAPVPWSS